MIIAILILAIVVIGLSIYCYKIKQQQQIVIEINQARQQENIEIERQVSQKKEELTQLHTSIEAQNKIIQSLTITEENLRARAKANAKEAYDFAKKEFDQEFLKYKEKTNENYNRQLENLSNQIAKEQEKLKSLQDKQSAYIEAQQRQKEIQEKKDYYRLVVDNTSISDINLLRQIQDKFSKKEAIDKLIWEIYYKPAYDILMPHLFNGTEKVSGIYKITNLITNEAYIGQSVDMRERFRQHLKTSLQYSCPNNKLYQSMQKDGQYNFTFEILEKVPREKLNERESYWISFYKTKEFGLNKTVGGS